AGNKGWSLTCSETAAQTRVWRMRALSIQWLHLSHGVRASFQRGGQPYLGARTRIVRRQDDRWGVIPAGLACGRSVFRGRPGCRGLAAGSVREPAAKHLRDDGLTRAGAGLSGRSWDRLLGLRLGFNRGERLIPQFT